MTSPRVKAIRKDIIFQFEDQATNRTVSGVKQTLFKDVTDWGFEITNTKDSMENARWVIVVATGPEVSRDDVRPGMRVMVEPLKWTNAFQYNGEDFWKTNIDHILLIDDAVSP